MRATYMLISKRLPKDCGFSDQSNIVDTSVGPVLIGVYCCCSIDQTSSSDSGECCRVTEWGGDGSNAC